MSGPTPRPVATRFWSKVDASAGPDACWPWLGGRKAKGYGTFFIRRDPPGRHGKLIQTTAHRMAYQLTNGAIDDGLVVRHTCDNPPCCNPAHLIPGTIADNSRDAMERGLWNPKEGYAKAAAALTVSRTARRTLTEEDIALAIVARAEGQNLSCIASTYDLPECALRHAFRGATYQELPLVQRTGLLYSQGIRFPYYRGNTTPATLHPALLALAEEARQLLVRMLEVKAQRDAEASALADRITAARARLFAA